MIIGRSKSQRAIDSQIDISAEGIQKVGNSKEFPEGGNQFSEGEGYVLPGVCVEIWIAPIPKCWSGMKRKRGTTQKEEKRKSKTPRC